MQAETISVCLVSLQLSVIKHGDFQAVSVDVKNLLAFLAMRKSLGKQSLQIQSLYVPISERGERRAPVLATDRSPALSPDGGDESI